LAPDAIFHRHLACRPNRNSQGHPEAAAVDGAGFWRTQLQIMIPMMRPIMSVAVLFGLIFTFTDMTVVYILTAGGPFDSTQTLLLWLLPWAFR